MRPWLVILGAAFLVVGAGALGALLLTPPASVTQEATSQLDGQFTPGGSVASFVVPAANASQGTLVVHWSASAPVSVRLVLPCPSGATGCAAQTLATWPSNSSGSTTVSGSLHWEYVLTWGAPAGQSATFSFSTSAKWTVTPPRPIADTIAEVASGLLTAVGAVALFLGLFLRGGFQRPPPLVSQGAEDAEAIGRATDPRTGTSDAGSGRPRPGPPSRSG
ncbi:MAG: hypothetical protein L3K00_01595 [Thermoplasmata archaeon]|nr:hypothetical protein [Thermoplasmata archaeon]MCI4361948.1 hypothetical protein [Thermoplasmata archaeon]